MDKKEGESSCYDPEFIDKATIPNKGIQFENLIEILLKAQFNNDYWIRTQTTHDGKKDFVHPNLLNPTEWLECKNYRDSISINVISPTLIMGAIEGISRIYFYSRSPLNDNALEDICIYGEKHEREIIVYDGKLLEYCFYKYKSTAKLEELFTNINLYNLTEEVKKASFRVFYSLRDAGGRKLTSNYIFRSGENFNLNIIIQNHCNFEKNNIKVKVKSCNKQIAFFNRIDHSDEYNTSITAVFGNLSKITVSCDALVAGNDTLQIEIEGDTPDSKKIFSRRIVISDEPYCFLIPKWEEIAQKFVNSLIQRKSEPIILCGPGGTGKSSILKFILSDKQVRESFTIVDINIGSPSQSIIRNVVEQLMWTNEDSSREPGDNYPELTLLADIFNTYLDSYEKFSEDMVRLFSTEKTAPLLFVFDDAQRISNNHILFINTIKEIFEQNNTPIYFIFCLNTEKKSCPDFLELLCWDEYYGKVDCSFAEISKFGRDEIISFFRCRFGLHDFEDLFNDCDKYISALEVSGFADDLQHSHIIQKIKRDDHCYTIIDNISFRKRIVESLYSENFLLEKCRNIGKNDIPNYILKYVYLNGEMDADSRGYRQGIRDLAAAQILKIVGNRAVFFHDKIRENVRNSLKFYNEDYANIFASTKTRNIAKAFCAVSAINHLRNAERYLIDYFKFCDDDVSPAECLNLCKTIIDNLTVLHSKNLAVPALKYIKNKYKFLNSEIGREVLAVFLDKSCKKLIDKDWWITNDKLVDGICYLFKKNLDRLLSRHYNLECMNVATECINKIENLNMHSKNVKSIWLFHFYNRRAIAKDRQNINSDNDYNSSYKYIDDLKSCKDIELQRIVDDFYRDYSYGRGFLSKTINKYLNDLQSLQKESIPEKIDNLIYHIELLKFIGGSEEPKAIRESLQVVIERNVSPFYAIKSRILTIYCYILENNFAYAYELCESALKFAYAHELRQFVFKLTYIRTFLEMKDAEHSYSSGKFRQTALIALKQIVDTYTETDKKEPDEAGTEMFLSADIIRILPLANYLIKVIERDYPDFINEFSGKRRHLIEAAINMSEEQLKPAKFKFVYDGVLFPDS